MFQFFIIANFTVAIKNIEKKSNFRISTFLIYEKVHVDDFLQVEITIT